MRVKNVGARVDQSSGRSERKIEASGGDAESRGGHGREQGQCRY